MRCQLRHIQLFFRWTQNYPHPHYANPSTYHPLFPPCPLPSFSSQPRWPSLPLLNCTWNTPTLDLQCRAPSFLQISPKCHLLRGVISDGPKSTTAPSPITHHGVTILFQYYQPLTSTVIILYILQNLLSISSCLEHTLREVMDSWRET